MAKQRADVSDLPDWWQREKRRRQAWFLIFLTLLLSLIAFYYWVSFHGVVGGVAGINFDTSDYIAFIHQDANGNVELYCIRADGTDARMLTDKDDKSNKQDPSWTVDGKNILYSSNKNDNKVMQIYKMGLGDARQLTYGPGNKFAPIASPDGFSIAFMTQGAVKTVLLNGNDVRQIMPPPSAGHAEEGDANAVGHMGGDARGPFLMATFSPDGKGIAGVQSLSADENPVNIGEIVPGDQVVRVLPANGDRALMLDTGREVSVAWEQSGARLAASFTEYQPPKENGKEPPIVSGIRLWSFDPSGKKATADPMVSAVGFTLEPKNLSWSPDGKMLAFECWRLKSEGNRELMGIVVLDASSRVHIQSTQEADSIPCMIKAGPDGKPQNPRWSPNGSRLLYEVTRPNGGHDICVINSDGTNQRILTEKLGGDNTQAAWAPFHK